MGLWKAWWLLYRITWRRDGQPQELKELFATKNVALNRPFIAFGRPVNKNPVVGFYLALFHIATGMASSQGHLALLMMISLIEEATCVAYSLKPSSFMELRA